VKKSAAMYLARKIFGVLNIIDNQLTTEQKAGEALAS
jgi:hypothetical protein